MKTQRKNPRMRTWLASVLACGCLLVTGCGGSIVEVRVILELELTVTSRSGVPVADLEVLLQDHGAPTKFWKRRRLPVCKTDKRGLCHEVVKFGYGESSWPWERAQTPRELIRRFEIFAGHNGQLVSLGFLPIEDARQAQGEAKVVYRARL